jgi:hypothetical protein
MRPLGVLAQDRTESRLLACRGPAEDREGRRKEVETKFEFIHRRRMLLEAEKYVALRYCNGPKLDALYFGELPMSIKTGSWGGYRPVAMTEARGDCYTFLNRTFKGQHDLFDEA